ncbi:MAG: hypothetical protein OXN17_02140 [Candidatus Poribacteria bacterium]|nr:hypothetical protein [Candidatus Poribacteria bacterium]MDE0503230.1 hypothetical protein [Candidatus Poribacteria bacterium]
MAIPQRSLALQRRHVGYSDYLINDFMLPFTIKVTHQPVERLCRISERNEQQNIDVEVDIHAHSREFLPLFAGRSIASVGSEALNEAMGYVYEAFIGFLQRIAQPDIFLPMNSLDRFSHRLYCLLMSPNRTREAFEICGTNPRNRLTFGDYEFVVSRKTQLQDTEAYLIAPSKYTLFMRQAIESHAINVYRSDFIDLVTNTPPPFNLHPQDVIDALASTDPEESERPAEGNQLLMFSPDAMDKAKEKEKVCPKCAGPVQKIDVGRYFCLDCEWDNLPMLN